MIHIITKNKFLKAICLAAMAGTYTSSYAQPFVKKNDIIQFTAGRWGAMSFVLNNKIYAGGGYVGGGSVADWQEYDPVSDNWAVKTNYLPGGANRSAGITFVINGKAYLGLGAEHYLSFPPQPAPKQLNDLWTYDPAQDKWTQLASLPDVGRTASAVFVLNNKAYIVGGETSSTGTLTDQVWEYDPATDKWTAKGTYPGGAMRNAMAFSINGKGYVTGGAMSSGGTKKTYEFNGSTWKPKSDFIDSARQGSFCFVADNKAFVGCGGTFGSVATSFFTYDPATDKWAFLTNKWPAQGRMFGVAQTIGNKAYLGFGWRLDGSTQTFFKDWYEADATGLLDVDDVHPLGNDIILYPNPAHGMVHIKATRPFAAQPTCTVYSIDGRKVYAAPLPADNTIDLRSYPAGKYVLELSTSDEKTATLFDLQ